MLQVGRAGVEAHAQGGATGRGWAYVAVPAVVTLGVCLWRIGAPSYWRDESVSVVVGRAGLAGVWDFVREVDAVHGLYYVFVYLVTLLGTGEAITRGSSAVAAALAAGGIAVLGRRFCSARAGMWGGLVYGLLPITSRYAQEVRQYALVSAGAVVAAYLLVRALETRRPPGRWYGAYAVSLALLGWLHLYSLFLLPAHAVAVLLWRHERHERGRIRHLVGWGLSAFTAFLVVLPLALVARGQEGAQVSWLRRPDLGAPYGFGLQVTGGGRVVLLVLALVAVAGAARLFAHDRNAAVLVVSWLVVPVAVAWTLSQVHPVYHPRYVLYCVCALALLSGVGLATLGEWAFRGQAWLTTGAATMALICLGAAVLPAQLTLRGRHSRPDDLRSLSAVLRERSRTGDAVLYVPGYRRVFVTVYAAAFARLNAAALHGPGTADLPTGRFSEVIGAQRRIWVVEVPPPGRRYRTPVPLQNLAALRKDKRFAAGRTWRFGGARLTLYTSDARRGARPARNHS